MPASSSAPRRAVARGEPDSGSAPRTRLWLEFVNTDAAPHAPRADQLREFDALLAWLVAHDAVDIERAQGLARRAELQPAAATATLMESRRVRATLRALAERGAGSTVTDHGEAPPMLAEAVLEINRVLGRSAGTRRLELADDGRWVRLFAPTGDAFAGLMIPIVESAADSLVVGELRRIRRCADPRCTVVFLDTSRNGGRRWCDMGTCGNRAKAARHRARLQPSADSHQDHS